jgi:hypothetical protein
MGELTARVGDNRGTLGTRPYATVPAARPQLYTDQEPPAIDGIIESVSFADTSERSFSGR